MALHPLSFFFCIHGPQIEYRFYLSRNLESNIEHLKHDMKGLSIRESKIFIQTYAMPSLLLPRVGISYRTSLVDKKLFGVFTFQPADFCTTLNHMNPQGRAHHLHPGHLVRLFSEQDDSPVVQSTPDHGSFIKWNVPV
jgi:hypothetical protein